MLHKEDCNLQNMWWDLVPQLDVGEVLAEGVCHLGHSCQLPGEGAWKGLETWPEGDLSGSLTSRVN